MSQKNKTQYLLQSVSRLVLVPNNGNLIWTSCTVKQENCQLTSIKQLNTHVTAIVKPIKSYEIKDYA